MLKGQSMKKGMAGVMLSVAMFATTVVGVHAASFSYPGTVTTDGLRLRKYPDTGTILELMYKGESVHVDKEMTIESGAAYYLKRDKTGTVGYADFHYVDVPGIWD